MTILSVGGAATTPMYVAVRPTEATDDIEFRPVVAWAACQYTKLRNGKDGQEVLPVILVASGQVVVCYNLGDPMSNFLGITSDPNNPETVSFFKGKIQAY